MSDNLMEIATGKNIWISIEDNGHIILGSVQNYKIKCEIITTKIPAMGECHPTDYYQNGRKYTIELEKVLIQNTPMINEDQSVYVAYGDGVWKPWQDFQLKINIEGMSGGKDRNRIFRNCYRVDCGESATYENAVIENITIVSHNCGYDKEDVEYHRRKLMKYGDFTFPYNPYRTEYATDRKYVEHKLAGLKKNDVEDFGVNGAVISCEGYFFTHKAHHDDTAIKSWNRLRRAYRQVGPQKTYHPIFTDITKSLMVNLKCEMEDQSGLIKYSFDLLEYNPPPVHAKKKSKSKSKAKGSNKTKTKAKKTGKVTSKNSKQLKVGATIYITGQLAHTSTGGKPFSRSYKHKRMTITKVAKSGSYPIHLGSVGWAKKSDISWS